MPKQINTAPKKKDDDGFYDYDAARKAGVTGPDKSGHWPSDFKKDNHPNINVGGFNTKTGKRVLGTKQASESELRNSGWDEESAARLTRDNTGTPHAKDVELPLNTAPKKSVAQRVWDAGEEYKRKNPKDKKFKNFDLLKRE